MPDIPLAVAGDDNFLGGMDSYTIPTQLLPGEFEEAMNIVNRGGLAQTRPGSNSLFDMPEGNLQGCTFFIPSTGIPHLVFAVDGLVYVSPSPFREYDQLNGVQFSPNSKFVAWAPCLKSTDYTSGGVLYYLDQPISVLIMQDGATRAAYWDGATSGHINPTPSTGDLTEPDRDGTPIGLWMKWSNNRLWVTRGPQVFASDIGNPLKFADSRYLNEGRSFYLSGACSGVENTPDRQGIVCFTSTDGTFFQSSIQDRTLWLSTPGFQKTVFHDIGCASPRSIVHQYGLLWWFTSKGLINQNDATQLYITSRLNIQDNEMIQSKSNVSYDISGICGGFYENFLFHAVPNGDKLNTRLHVLDQAPFEESPNSWPGYWTGWRPVEFARGVIGTQERVFCASYDYDGVNRMWELFKTDRTDNGMPITSFVATRQHLFENREYKRFRYAELELNGISGPTAMMVAAAGTRGGFQPVMVKDMNATNGQVYADSIYGEDDHLFSGSSSQTRILKTEDGSNASECNDECVESDIRGLIDKAFSILIMWSGIAGVSAYRVFAQFEPKPNQGVCEDNETGENRLITSEGCGELERFSTKEPFTTYYSTATFSRINPSTALVVSHTSSQSSIISQVDADRKAQAMAEWYVLSEIGEIV